MEIARIEIKQIMPAGDVWAVHYDEDGGDPMVAKVPYIGIFRLDPGQEIDEVQGMPPFMQDEDWTPGFFEMDADGYYCFYDCANFVGFLYKDPGTMPAAELREFVAARRPPGPAPSA